MPPKRATAAKKTKKVVDSDSESDQSESSEDYEEEADEEEDDEEEDDDEEEAEEEEEALEEADEASRGDIVENSSDSDSEKASARKSTPAPKRKANPPSEPAKKTKRVAAPSPSEHSLEEGSSNSSSSSSNNVRGSNCGNSSSSTTSAGPSSARSTKNIPKAPAVTNDDDVAHTEPEPEEEENTNGSGERGDDKTENGSGGETGPGGASEGGEEKKKKKKKTVSNELKAKMRGDGPASKILAVMYNINRPGNVTSVEGWTSHKIPKGIVQNSLEELAKSGELSVTGKTGKVYWFNQNQFRTKGLDLIKLTKKVEEQNEALAKLKEEHGALAKEMRNLEAKPTDADLPGAIQELVDRRDALTAKVSTLKSSSVALTPAQKDKQRKQFMLYRDAWSKRKRYCQDACGAVADGMDKKVKDIESLIGIETDDDVGHQVPPLSALGISNRPVITMRTIKGRKKR